MTRKAHGQGRFSNRQKTWFWIILTTAVVTGLLYWEQIALLYVMATVSVTLLLLIVAKADLSGARALAPTIAVADATPSIEGGGNVTQPAAQSTFGSRPRKRRR